MVDFDKVLWSTLYPMDKVIVAPTAPVVITNDGATVQSPQTAQITTTDITNDTGRKLLARAVWSLDKVSWQSTHSRLTYTFSITAPGPTVLILNGLKAAVSIGCSSSVIRIVTANGLHNNVTDNGVTYTYTPTSQTFYVKYALFEIA